MGKREAIHLNFQSWHDRCSAVNWRILNIVNNKNSHSKPLKVEIFADRNPLR